MKLTYLLFTAVTVSVDSVLFGTKLTKKDKRNLFFIAISTLIIFFTCLLSCFSGKLLGKKISEKSHVLSGLILILIAVYDYFYSSDVNSFTKDFKKIFLLSLALGTDGFSAGFSLSLSGYDPLTVSVTFTIFHILFVCLSKTIIRRERVKKIVENKYFCPIIMAVLGIYKIISCLL